MKRQSYRDAYREASMQLEFLRGRIWQQLTDPSELHATCLRAWTGSKTRGAFVSSYLQEPVWQKSLELMRHKDRLPPTVHEALTSYEPEDEFLLLFYPWKGVRTCGFRIQTMESIYEDSPYSAYDIIERIQTGITIKKEMDTMKISVSPSGERILHSPRQLFCEDPLNPRYPTCEEGKLLYDWIEALSTVIRMKKTKKTTTI